MSMRGKELLAYPRKCRPFGQIPPFGNASLLFSAQNPVESVESVVLLMVQGIIRLHSENPSVVSVVLVI